MDHDDSPGLSVGFAVDTGGSFENLLRLEKAMDGTESRLLPAAARIERGTANMVNLSGATAQITTFGVAATRELQNINREKAQTAKVGEALVRQLDRESTAFGKTKEEMRAAKVEAIALAASQQGNTDLADRLLAASRQRRAAAEAVAEAETAAASARASEAARQRVLAEAAVNAQLLERSRIEAALGRTMGADRPRATDAGASFSALAARAADDEARALREAANAYQMFEAAAQRGAQTMREQEAATVRDADALARLRAMIDPTAAAQDRLNAELAEARRLMTAAGASAEELTRAEDALWARSQRVTQQHEAMAGAARNNGFALRTVALQLPDITQGLLTGQKPMTVFIQQGFQIVQVAQMAEGGLRGFGKELSGLALRFAPILAVAALAAAGFALFNRWVNQGVTNNQLTHDLGDITGGANATKAELYKLKDATITWGDTSSAIFSVVGKDIAQSFVGDMKSMASQTKNVLDDLTSYGRSALAGMYAAAKGTQAYMGEVSSRKGLWGLVSGSDKTLLDRTYGAAYREADAYLGNLGARVRTKAVENARERLAKTIGYNNIPKPKEDHRAEQLARENEAIEAQIKNLYDLAAAYGVSGAAALIAEARVKAESDAIKKRGDVEQFVDRQVRLSIAQRVSDAEKGAAATRDQAGVQTDVNQMVANGLIPAERANELLQDRIADLPLLAAIEAAQQRGLTIETQRATKALEDQQSAQADAKAAARGAQFVADDAAADRQLAGLREELRLVGETEEARSRALAVLRATQDAELKYEPGSAFAKDTVAKQMKVYDATMAVQVATADLNDALSLTADRWDIIASKVQTAGQGMADAFGNTGRAIGDIASVFANFQASRARADAEHQKALDDAKGDQARERENALFALRSSGAQVGLYGDMAAAAKGFFNEKSKGYQALATAEKVFRTIEFALSVRAMAQDAAETAGKIASSVLRTAKYAVEAVVKAISSLPFPLNLAAGAATVGAIAALGVSIAGGFGGSGTKPAPSNTGTGTVLGDSEAKSESIKRAIDQLRDVDTLMLSHSREMAASLRSIDRQIGGFAAQILKAGDINANAGVTEGFKTDTTGKVLGSLVDPFSLLSKIPVIGGVFSAVKGIISSLFGSKTQITGTGLYGGGQSLGSVLSGGFDAQNYTDVKKTKKFLGITTGTSYSTQYSGADPTLENQFTLILRSFNDAIAAAAGPLGESTGAIQQRLNGFVVNIGKIDLTGLTGEQITEKLTAVFGAAADEMAGAAFPGVARFQKAGEGLFETAVRVALTLETVGASLDLLGGGTRQLSMDAKLGIADQFESLSALTSAADGYFKAYYTSAEQAAAQTARFSGVFDSLGMAMPSTLAGFRALVEAQDLTTAAGQSTYATLLQLAPAFADLQSSMAGANSAADIASERQDLQRQLLELRGDTAAIRALDLAKLDASNRALQTEIYLIQDAQKAADAADQLRQAWTSVGDSIASEVERIRGLNGASSEGGFAVLQGRFNAATLAARGGDQDAAKSLPGLSQALLTAAAAVATSRQELDRVQAMTASSLEATKAAIDAVTVAPPSATSTAALLAAAANTQAATTPASNDNVDLRQAIDALRAELAAMHADNNAGHAATAGNTGKVARIMDTVTAESQGTAVTVAAAA